jgi:hypothetical protein
MANFVRLQASYQYTETEDGITVTEQYMRDDNAASAVAESALPVVGTTLGKDPNDAFIANCVCRKKTGVNTQGDKNSVAYVFEFSTNAGGGEQSPGADVSSDPNFMRAEMGTETVTWNQGFVISGGVGVGGVRDPIHRIVPTGSFTVPKGPLTAGQNTAFWAKVTGLLGRINSVKWVPGVQASGIELRKGSALFMGISGGTSYDGPDLVWKWEMAFAWKMIAGEVSAGVPIAEDDWQYVPDRSGYWVKTSPLLYQLGDFWTLV